MTERTTASQQGLPLQVGRLTQAQLERYLWGAATLLRGVIDAGDYKQFIFPLLFFKSASQTFTTRSTPRH